jgi:hypothetical protein
MTKGFSSMTKRFSSMTKRFSSMTKRFSSMSEYVSSLIRVGHGKKGIFIYMEIKSTMNKIKNIKEV